MLMVIALIGDVNVIKQTTIPRVAICIRIFDYVYKFLCIVAYIQIIYMYQTNDVKRGALKRISLEQI